MLVPIAYLQECLDYEPLTGILVWRCRPASHFVSVGSMRSWNTRCAGTFAGRISKNGYVHVNVTFKRKVVEFYAHRLAFALMTDTWPTHEIDHKNRERSDNRWLNLRPATRVQNQRNRVDRLGWPDLQA